MLPGRVLPVVAVEVSPRPPQPALEERLLGACSAGLAHARCIAAGSASDEPEAIAFVAWLDAVHVSIQVGLSGRDQAAWRSRELTFDEQDPELERWRAIGFTIALLADDRRLAPPRPAEDPIADVPPVPGGAGFEAERLPVQAELLGVVGTGLDEGPVRLGAEARLSVAFAEHFFATSGVGYTLAHAAELDVRWFDASLGLGLYLPQLWRTLDGRLRVEVLTENVAATAQLDSLSDQRSAWVPGLRLGGDLLWHVAGAWLASAHVEAFWLDGSTAITSAGSPVATSAGAGLTFGLGAGYGF
jgi:hypothetical protein